MTVISFVHLHVHSHYSLLDGFSSPEALIEKTAEEDYPALALTEHGNVHSWYEHYKTCNENDIKPIIGCEFYITSVFAEDGLAKDEDTYHLVVLAKNDKGRNNLFSLVTLSNTEGFYYKPRISFKLLKEYSEGLIVLSACQQGEVPRHVLNEDYDKAAETAKEYKEIFGDDYYLEIMPTGTTEQYIVNNNVKEISEKLNIEPVATVDIHYLNPEDEKGQDILLAVNTGKKLDDKDRLTFDSDQYYYKTRREIADGLFRGHNCLDFAERACDNTLQIANKVEEHDVDTGNMYLPDYELPEDETLEGHLRKLCYNSLYELALEKDIDIDEYADRLDHEIEVISMKGYCKYFLVTADLMEWAAENNVLSGPSRGSAGGCLVSYLLNITKIDPIEHGLLFTRFLNPERDSFPDKLIPKILGNKLVELVRNDE